VFFLFAALITYYTSAPLGDFANNYFGSYFYTQGVDLKEVDLLAPFRTVAVSDNIRETGGYNPDFTIE